MNCSTPLKANHRPASFNVLPQRRGTLLALAAAALLAACGGGGDEGEGTATAASIAGQEEPDGVRSALAAGTTLLAGEGIAFRVSGVQTVRYGTDTRWVWKTLYDGGTCTNAFFGSDPAVGVGKRCELVGVGTDNLLANEWQNFTVASAQSVRFGADSRWTTRTVSGTVACTASAFGGDPAPGAAKRCEAVAAPPVATAPPQICTPPLALAATAGAAVVGSGTPASCTEAALRSAVAGNANITFNCGAAPATIRLTQTLDLPTNRNTVIDGGGKVTLDGGNSVRLMRLWQSNYRTNSLGLTLQRITLANGRASGSGYVAPSTTNPSCAYGYAGGSGGAIEVRDARLHVIDVEFRRNAAATPGPDVGGGAIYAMGSLDVTVVGSRFVENTGANAGAVGLLQTNGRFVNNLFQGNTATGTGTNYAGGAAAGCPGVGHANQGGAGGNGGAIAIDGNADTDQLVCGSSFLGNRANELAGALFRTANGTARRTTIDRSRFDGNQGRQGGALFLRNSNPLEINASTLSNNTAVAYGAGQLDNSRLDIVNSTLTGNVATRGVGGALALFNSTADSTIRNTTFAYNRAPGGPGFFSAAVFGSYAGTYRNTLFVQNTTADAWNPMQCFFSPSNGSGNLQWPRTRSTGGANDTLCVNAIAFADPLLGPLQDNGGPTLTLAPAALSPARNAGTGCPATDQRGRARNTSACTLGAVE